VTGATATRPSGGSSSHHGTVTRAGIGDAARGLASDWTVIAVAALTVLTFALRFSQLHQSLFGDESFTYQDIAGRTLAQVVKNVHTGNENSPPLFFVLAFASAKLGNPIFWIRLPSIVFGAAILPVIYMIGRDTVGRVRGLVAAGIVALSPFSMYYGVEARPYATMAFFAAVSTWALLRAVDRGERRYWPIYTIAAALACYSHYTCAFVLIVQGAWSLWACRRRIIEPLIAQIAVVALYIPWVPYLRGKSLAVIGALEPLTAHNVVIDAARTIVGYPYAPLRAIPTYLGLAIVLACVAVGFCLLARSVAARGPLLNAASQSGPSPCGALWPPHFWLLVAIALATPVLLLLYSMASTDLWLARNLYASMPAQALVLATIVAVPYRRAAWALGLALAAVLAVGLVRSLSPSWERTPYYTIARYLDRNASATQPVKLATFYGDLQLPILFDRPHLLAAPGQFDREARTAERAYAVADRFMVRGHALQQAPPAPPGMVIARRIRYHNAIMPGTEVVVYRRVHAAR
jgi:uncharacterized membrane protein